MGVKGFFISWANFLETFSHAECLSAVSNYSCCIFKRSVIWLNVLINFLISESDSSSIFSTLASKLPELIFSDAFIKDMIGFVSLDAKSIDITIDKKSNNETIII